MTTLYGIPNCDSCRNARRWLENAGVTFKFHDLREDGLTKKQLQSWCKSVEWKKLLNTRSTTWRQLSENDRAVANQADAVALMAAHPTLVKRPVLEHGSDVAVGFSASAYEEKFG